MQPDQQSPAKPKAPRRWVIWLFLGLFFLFLAAEVVVESSWITGRLTEWVQARLSHAVGREVRLKRARLRLIPAVLFLEEVSLPPTLESRRIRVQVSLWSILTRSFIIQTIQLEEPLIRVGPDFPLPLPVFSASAEGNRDVPPIVVRSVRVRNGHLIYKNEGAGPITFLDIGTLTGTMEPDLFMRRFELRFTAGRSSLRSGDRHFQVARVEAKGEARAGRVDVKKLELVFPDGQIYTNGSVTIAGEPSVDLFVRAALPLGAFNLRPLFDRDLSGQATFQGEVKGPVQKPSFRGKGGLNRLTVDKIPVGDLSFDLDYHEDRLSLTGLSGAVLSGRVSGEAAIALSSNRYRVEGRFEGIDPRPATERLITGLPIPDGRWGGEVRIEATGLDLPSIQGEGILRFESHPQPATGALPDGSEGGPFLKLAGLVERGEIRWEAKGGILEVKQAELQLPESALAFSGKASAEALAIRVDLQSKRIERLLAPWRVPLEGAARIEAGVSGPPGRPVAEGRFVLDRGRFERRPLGRAEIPFRYDGETLALTGGTLVYGEGSYRFSGKIDRLTGEAGGVNPRFELSIGVKNVDPQQVLALFLPDFPLRTHSTGRLTVGGTWNAPRVSGKLELEEGTLYDEPFDRARVSFRVEEEAVRFSSVEWVRGEDRLLGSGEIGFHGAFKGEIRSEGFSVERIRWIEQRLPELSARISGRLAGEGSFGRPRFSATLKVQEARYKGVETGPGEIEATADRDKVGFRGVFSDRGLQAEGEVRLSASYPFRIAGSFSQVKIDPFIAPVLRSLSPELPTKVSLTASGKLEAEGTLAQLLKSAVRLSLSEFSADVSGYTVSNDGEIRVELADEVLSLTSVRLKGEETALHLSGAMKLYREFDLFVNGEAGLRLLGLLTRNVSYGKGKVYLVLKISDRWEDPKLLGGVTVHDGVVRFPSLSAPVNLTDLSLFFDGKQFVLESLDARVGKGRLQGSGKAELDRFVPVRYGLLLEMDALPVNLINGLSSTIAGTLLFQGSPESKELKGDIQILHALYNKRLELKSWLLQFKGEGSGPAARPISSVIPLVGATLLNVHFSGHEDILINNNIAKFPLEVDLFLRGSLSRPLLFGRVEAPRGSFRFRRNEFTLSSASVEFLNPDRIAPQFDLKAKTSVRSGLPTPVDYAINLSLAGNFDRFTMSLSSTPSLPEPDILSLLTVGKTTEEIGQGGTSVSGEAVSFVVSEFLEEPVSGLTGIDQFQVAPSTDENARTATEVTIGKRLMEDRLLVTYKTTLDPSQEQLVRMEYELNENVSLVGQRDKEGRIGGDIKFRFEFR